MDALTAGPLIGLGFTIGVPVMLLAFMFVMPTVVKFPGSHCVGYWAAGLTLLIASLVVNGVTREQNFFLLRMAIFAGVLGSYMLIWLGERYFQLQPPGKRLWPTAGIFFCMYVLFEQTSPSPDQRMAALSTVSILFWLLLFCTISRRFEKTWTLPSCLMMAGLAMLIANSSLRILIALEVEPFLATFSSEDSYLPARFIGTMLGSTLFEISNVLCYFGRVVQQSNHAATHDELTGLLNRRAIVLNGEREIELARRNRQPLAVAFVDIDFFKKINDQYGHDKGDLALREVANVLMQNCRNVDLLGRYGGEEFCLIFPGDDHAGAEIVGERLLVAVRDYQITGLPPVTISIGLAVLDLNDAKQTWHSLINQADVELYKAKHGGRNRCSIAQKKVPAEEAQAQFGGQKLVSAG